MIMKNPTFIKENSENKEHKFYQIRMFKRTGIVIIYKEDEYHKINFNSEQIEINHSKNSNKIVIKTSDFGQNMIVFLFRYEYLNDATSFYQKLVQFQLEIEQKKDSKIYDLKISE